MRPLTVHLNRKISNNLDLSENVTATDEIDNVEVEGNADGDYEMDDAMMMMMGDQIIGECVDMENQQATKYRDLVINLQIAYYQSSAAQLFINKQYSQHQNNRNQNGFHVNAGASISFLEIDSSKDFEEDAEGPEYEGDDGKVYLNQQGIEGHKMRLLASLNLFHSIKVFNLKTMFMASNLQQEFFATRAAMLKFTMYKDLIPPELISIFYVQMGSLFLKTQSLSLALQTVSTWTTWLEDELDFGIAILSNLDVLDEEKIGDYESEITDGRMWAFTTFSNFANIELTIFTLDYYVQYQSAQIMQQSGQGQIEQEPSKMNGMQMNMQQNMQQNIQQKMRQNNLQTKMRLSQMKMPASTGGTGQSFLETGAEAKTKTKFVAALVAPFVLGGDHLTYTNIYTFYQVFMQKQAADSGLMSAYAMKQASGQAAQQHMDSGLATQAKNSAEMHFGAFASGLQQVANVGYITALWKMYFMYREWQDPNSAAMQCPLYAQQQR